MSLDARVRFLTITVICALIVPGLLMIIDLALPKPVMMPVFLDFAFQPTDGGQPVETGAARLLAAILAGIAIGFGTLIWQIAAKVFRSDPALGTAILVPGILAWFVTDSLASILAGAWFNAVLNLGFLAVLLFPILWRRDALVGA